MRFVPIKTDDQLDMQSLHRLRERWVIRRTAVVNQIRGLLLERGILSGRVAGISRLRCRESSKTQLPGCTKLSYADCSTETRTGGLANFIGKADGWLIQNRTCVACR